MILSIHNSYFFALQKEKAINIFKIIRQVKFTKVILFFVGCLLLTSCTGFRSPENQLKQKNIALPRNFVNSGEGKNLNSMGVSHINNWVSDFNDVNLNKLIYEAFESSPDYLALLARLKSARAFRNISPLLLAPNLSLSGSSTRSASAKDNQNNRSYSNSFGISLNTSWEIDLWGKLSDDVRSALLKYSSQEASHRAVELLLVANIVRSWYRLSSLEQQLRLTLTSIKTSKNNLDATERRYKLGVAGAIDVRLARSNLATVQARQINLRQAQNENIRRLEVVLGRYPSAAIKFKKELPILKKLHVDIHPADVLVRRPDVIASEANLKAAQIDVSSARKAFLPSITLSARALTSQSSWSDAFNADKAIANFIAGFTMPIFARGRIIANERSKTHLAQAALNSYVSTVLGAMREIENGLAAEKFLSERVSFLTVAFEESKKAEELVTQRYISGTSTIFELLNSQSRHIQAETDLISANYDYISNRVNFYLAIGGSAFSKQNKPNNMINKNFIKENKHTIKHTMK